jgi:hypothetical protein
MPMGWLGLVISMMLSSAASGENFIKVEMGGRSFVIDADSDTVQKNLKPANAQAGQQHLPAWLAPYSGAAPVRANYDARTGISSATFQSGGDTAQVASYYQQLLESRGYRSNGPLGQGKNLIVSGKNASGAISVMVNVPFRGPPGAVEIIATYSPVQTKSNRKHFEAAWFDDKSGILCLRDTASGEEYLLDQQGILEANLNRPGAVASQGAAMPAWLPVYPNAQRASVKVIWSFEPTATFQTQSSIQAVYDFYKEAVKRAGATLVSSGIVQSGKPLKDFSAQVVAQLGDDVVDIRIGEIVNLNPIPLANTRPPAGTGIGIRYTVPKR